MIFIDADFFIGLYLTSDSHHSECLSLSNKIEDELITSYDVLDEVITKLSYFKRKDLALQFWTDLHRNSMIIVYPDQFLFKKAVSLFKSQKLTHVSLTDCMNMAIAREKKITRFLSFDKMYVQNGFSLIM